jgi:hypothetical protein
MSSHLSKLLSLRDILALGGPKVATPEPERRPTWTELTELEPRLLDLLEIVRGTPRRQFYKRWEQDLKGRLMHLVGWERAGSDHANRTSTRTVALHTSAAYDVAYAELRRAPFTRRR